jgi:hypothetical protein
MQTQQAGKTFHLCRQSPQGKNYAAEKPQAIQPLSNQESLLHA